MNAHNITHTGLKVGTGYSAGNTQNIIFDDYNVTYNINHPNIPDCETPNKESDCTKSADTDVVTKSLPKVDSQKQHKCSLKITQTIVIGLIVLTIVIGAILLAYKGLDVISLAITCRS